MRVKFNDFKSEYQEIKEEVDLKIKKVLEGGWYILGKEVEKFEKEFSTYCGCKYGVGVASGTEALQLSLIVNNIGKGDEVITVANTAVPTIIAIMSAGAKPVFVDIEEDFYTIDSDKIEEKISKKTKAIIPVHLYGNACEMNKIINIAKKHKLKVIEDACQAHGSEFKNKKLGSFGDLGCFSFYPTKNLGAYGDGGMIVTNNKKIADKLKIIRNCGQDRNYIHPCRGINSRLDEIQAAILRVKLKYLDIWNKRRRENAKLYLKKLKNFNIKLPKEREYSKSNYHLFVIRPMERKYIYDFLRKKEIDTMIHYPMPIYRQRAYKDIFIKYNLSKTEMVSREVLSLPIHPYLREEEIRFICNKIEYNYLVKK
jgi:dTDP-4-amino-4,6-dideoxygalactose transaminase